MNDFVNELVVGLLKSPIIFIMVFIGVIYVIFYIYKKIKSISNIGELFNNSNNYNLAQNTCPKCGGALQIRNGKYGQFYGCSNYPRCKYTKKI